MKEPLDARENDIPAEPAAEPAVSPAEIAAAFGGPEAADGSPGADGSACG